jgi:methyl-accepting chemotaxis protein
MIQELLVTLHNAKRLDDKEDATASKLAHILHNLAEEIDTRMIAAAVNKIKTEIKAIAYVIDSLIPCLPHPCTSSNNNQVTKELSERLDKTTKIIQTLSNKIESLTATTQIISSSVDTIPAAVEKNTTAYRDALLSNPAPTLRTTAPNTEEEACILARYEVLA